MRAPGVGVAAVAVDGQRVLVVLRGRPPAVGFWSFPGGRLELGEGLRDGVRREVREECGLDIEVGALLEVVEHVEDGDGETHHWIVLDWLARVTGGTLTAGDDAREARWVTLHELADLPTTPRVPELAERALALADGDGVGAAGIPVAAGAQGGGAAEEGREPDAG